MQPPQDQRPSITALKRQADIFPNARSSLSISARASLNRLDIS
jgi:hypothetical protein